MKKFVTIFMGSRGILEEVNLIETELSLEEYSQNIVESLYQDIDEEDLEMVQEFIDITECEGFTMVGLNEEEHLILFDFEVDEKTCNELLEFWENEDEDGIMKIVDNLAY